MRLVDIFDNVLAPLALLSLGLLWLYLITLTYS